MTSCALSHVAFRADAYSDYVDLRDALERFCVANVENVWNGRPISKMLLKKPLDLGRNVIVSLLELIPPPHQAVYKMGLEHLGVVIGESIDEFATEHRAVLTGQQFQSDVCEPHFVTFPDHTNVKFYRYSLQDVLVREGHRFDDIYHVDRRTAGQ